MNNNFPGAPIYAGTIPTPNQSTAPTVIPFEQSYIENILRANKGKKARVHITIPESVDYKDKEFSGILEQAGRDHIIMSDPTDGKWYLILMIYVDFIVFDEAINYY